MANKLEILTKDLSTKITQHPKLFERGQESINYIDSIDIIKLRPNALKYLSIYSLLPTSWQDYLKSLDKESYRQAFDVLRMILLEEDMDYADKVLKETLKHKSTSPEAVEITYKRFKEDHTSLKVQYIFQKIYHHTKLISTNMTSCYWEVREEEFLLKLLKELNMI